MIIYGVALLAGCYMAGNLIGDVLGMALGVNANIGGVGFAMLLLIIISTWAEQRGIMKGPEEAGIKFWAAEFYPECRRSAFRRDGCNPGRRFGSGSWFSSDSGTFPASFFRTENGR